MIALNLLLAGTALPPVVDDPPFALPSRAVALAAPSARRGERLVAAYYFYWYRHPDRHFQHLRLHPTHPGEVSYESSAWHLREMRDMAAAGIDVALPVYWGVAGDYDRGGGPFSVRGLPPLAAALDELQARGEGCPRVGMFYDTTTLLHGVQGENAPSGRVDLRTPAGRDHFYRTIRDYFCQVPPRHWAQIDGAPLVVLYSSAFAAGYDQKLFDEVRERFARDFHGKRPFIVRERSWTGVKTDAEYGWGAALSGPIVREGTVAIGPGYDDTPVPGRRTPIREREDGRFYEKSWIAALASERDIVLLETWNEHHEGTSIGQTVEFGRRYIELTARYAAAFKRRERLPDGIELRYPDPRPLPDLSWGAAARGLEELVYRCGEGAECLCPVPLEDGPFGESASPEDGRFLRTAEVGKGQGGYLYFRISDHFAFDVDGEFELRVRYRSPGAEELWVEFDSCDREALLLGAYTRTEKLAPGAGRDWREARVRLPRARFANRQNGGADLRFRVQGAPLELSELRLRRLER